MLSNDISVDALNDSIVPTFIYIVAVSKYVEEGPQDEGFWDDTLSKLQEYPVLAQRLENLRNGAPANLDELSLNATSSGWSIDD